MKKFILYLIVTVLTLTCCFNASAEGAFAPPAYEISSNPNMASYAWYRDASQRIEHERDGDPGFFMVRLNIVSNNSTSVDFTCHFLLTEAANSIFVELIVKQWKNNHWIDYYIYDDIQLNSLSYTTLQSISVESGYYYKLSGFCSAYFLNYQRVYHIAETQSIYVN